MAAEYVMSSGNPNVILCERGIRTFETAYRNTLDVTSVPLVHQLTHLPVMVDPSHAAGKRWLVAPLALAGTAAGADGLLIEVHPRPAEALSDGDQSVTPAQFLEIAAAVRGVHGQVRALHATRGPAMVAGSHA
jgi:3-deoxy-7-phosphoheptulonate synthase